VLTSVCILEEIGEEGVSGGLVYFLMRRKQNGF
jgi:hypothetical protein